MIDIRSDTLTRPTSEMYDAIKSAALGDASRPKSGERCGDPTADALELAAARMMGHEDAAFVCSGTMGNSCALLAWARPGDNVLIEKELHVYMPERTAFSERIGRLVPIFYECTADDLPDTDSIEQLLKDTGAKVVCIENTHNARGGRCMPVQVMSRIADIAHAHGAVLHLDGARIFNAAEALGVTPKEIAQIADSVMFCVSKGPGAPFGSIVCGRADFMEEVREVRQLLGGGLRQSGVVAAPALYALNSAMTRAADDNARARRTATELRGLRHIRVQEDVESNIVMLQPADMTRDELVQKLEERGLLVSRSGRTEARMVFHREIGDSEAAEVINIIKVLDSDLG